MADAVLSLGIDATGVKQGRDEAVRSLEDIRKVARETAAEMGKSSQQITAAGQSIGDRIAKDLKEAARQIEEMKRAGASNADMSRFLRDFERDAKSALSSLNGPEWRTAYTTLTNGLDDVRKSAFSAGNAFGGGAGGGGGGGSAAGGAAGMPLTPAVLIFSNVIGNFVTSALQSFIHGLSHMAAGVVTTADAWDMLHKRVTVATADIGDGTRVFDDLRRSVVGVGGDMNAAVSLFQNMSRAAGSLGASNQDLTRFVDTVQKLGSISGATPAQMSAGLLQLSQGMSLGILRGQDLRSVIEQIPEVANAIAKGLDVTIGQLRQMGEQGELTGRKVMNALLDQAPTVDRRFKDLGLSLSQSASGFGEAWASVLDLLNQRLGITKALAAGIRALTPDLTTTQEAQQRSVERLGLTFQSYGRPTSANQAARVRTERDYIMAGGELEADYYRSFAATNQRTIDAARIGYDQLIKELDPLQEKYTQIKTQVEELNRAYDMGAISLSEYDRGLELLRQASDAARSPVEKLRIAIRDQADLAGLTGLAKTQRQAEIRARDVPGGDRFTGESVSGATTEFMSNVSLQIDAIGRQTAATIALKKATLDLNDEEVRRAQVQAKVTEFVATNFLGREKEAADVIDRYRRAVEAASIAERDLHRAQQNAEFLRRYQADVGGAAALEASMEEQSQANARGRVMARREAFSVEQLREQTEAAGKAKVVFNSVTSEFELYNREQQVVVEYQRLLNAGWTEGTAAARSQAEAIVDQRYALEHVTDAQKAQIARMNDAKAAGQDFSHAISTAFEDGILRARKFMDVLTSLAETIAQIALRIIVTKPLENALKPAFQDIATNLFGVSTPTPSAYGNIFRSGSIVPFARGGVITRPILFPMKNGAGLAGEAGEEGIVPLERINGKLGVNARVGGGPIVIVENIDQRSSGQPVETEQSIGPNGQVIIRNWIRDEINRHVESGQADAALARRYGVGPMPIARG